MLQEILASDWLWYALAGFGANGFITQAVAITPTKKDDRALGVIGVVIKALTGTFGMTKEPK
jgi:hypothetical protein